MSNVPSFTAIVLAGSRSATDPVASDAGVSCKAIASVGGQPMVTRVLDALTASRYVEKIIICGPAADAVNECSELQEYLQRDDIERIDDLDSPSKSVEAAMSVIGRDVPVFLTTADHALLETEVVDFFLEQSAGMGPDATVGLVEHEMILGHYPEVKRTVINFQDAGVCGCNLFSFLNERGRAIVPFWRQVEQKRKKPWKLVLGLLGLPGVLKYAMNTLTRAEALGRISNRLGIQITAVILPYPRAGIDVDTVKDRKFVEKILSESA